MKSLLKKAYTMYLSVIAYLYLKKKRKQLRVKHPTIISSNCIGGVISNRLGQKFMSPTVNLWMTYDDYFDFIEHFTEYKNSSIEQVIDKNVPYPVGWLSRMWGVYV